MPEQMQPEESPEQIKAERDLLRRYAAAQASRPPGMVITPDFKQGCAFEDGVIHDHGNAACHAATAVEAAKTAVASFLHGLAAGLEVKICRNSKCRVNLFVVDSALGTKIPTCPACYWAPLEDSP